MDLLTADVPTRAQSLPPRGTFTHTLSRLTRSTDTRAQAATSSTTRTSVESVGEEKKRLCAQAAAPRFSL